MNAHSGHWFSASPGSTPAFSAELCTEPQPPAQKGRRAERVPLELGAGLRQRGASGVSVQILDLSTDGFRASTHLDLAPGADVWLRLPGLEPCHAQVVWSERYLVGCKFVRPLHGAVLDMIVNKSGGR